MTDSYTNSKGQLVVIAEMLTPHLRNAHAKAEREYNADEDLGGWRAAEIEAMRVDLERRDAEYAAEQEGQADD